MYIKHFISMNVLSYSDIKMKHFPVVSKYWPENGHFNSPTGTHLYNVSQYPASRSPKL